MKYLHALFIAFSTYSRIPMPKANWNEENRRNAMLFFPMVGLVIGCVMTFWLLFCDRMGVSGMLLGVGCTAIPLLITGGIHMDGFMDTTDAMASWKPREQRLAILKDSHTGAFAVMGCCLYLLCMAAVMSEADLIDYIGLLSIFIISRAMSALTLVWMKRATESSSLPSFTQPMDKLAVTVFNGLYLAMAISFLLIMPYGWTVMVGAVVCVLIYWHRAYKYFGGVTGDLTGWFLQVSELVMIACLILGRMVLK